MIKEESSIDINQPADRVFQFLADGTNNPKWRPDVIEIALVSGKPGATGATYQQFMNGPMGRKIQGDYKLAVVTPNTNLAFDVVVGPARPHGEFTLSGAGNATKVSFVLSLEPKTFLEKMMSPMIRKTMKAEMKGLEGLKKALES